MLIGLSPVNHVKGDEEIDKNEDSCNPATKSCYKRYSTDKLNVYRQMCTEEREREFMSF